ncbi:hypothetical protein NG895_18010 [Aeoliella sp. ICT_H6.2]|uniref:Uncharacterized protein n=1 Tax=Aeoliella straminimaris TaxID=2954799 RepID=A0A9X2FB96_9BACT|nr:hypothetical protein [Aeoliella straminimaris]MCO6045797.1 hypothetical protein [Aeoliella straminimaris]
MKFSLKWLLVVVTYLAVATAACVHQGYGWRWALWVGNLLLVLYAVLAVVYFRGRSQAMALGFVLYAVAATVAMMRFATLSPIADAIRPFVPAAVATNEEIAEAAERVERLRWEMVISANAASTEYRDRTQQQYKAAQQRLQSMVPLMSLAGAVESLCVMAAGLVGCVVGRHVWTVAQRQQTKPAEER